VTLFVCLLDLAEADVAGNDSDDPQTDNRHHERHNRQRIRLRPRRRSHVCGLSGELEAFGEERHTLFAHASEEKGCTRGALEL